MTTKKATFPLVFDRPPPKKAAKIDKKIPLLAKGSEERLYYHYKTQDYRPYPAGTKRQLKLDGFVKKEGDKLK